MKAKGNRNGILDSNRKHSLSIAMIGIVAIAALAILMAGKASAADLWVPTQYSTIQDALDAAAPGDTIHVNNSVYNEALWVNTSVNLVAEGRHVIIQLLNSSGIHVQADNVTIDGFKIIGLPVGASGDDWNTKSSSSKDPTILVEANNIIVRNCIFNNPTGNKGKEAMLIMDGYENITFDNNTVNNYIWGITGRSNVNNLTVTNSTFYITHIRNNSVGTLPAWIVGAAIQLYSGNGTLIKNNEFYGPKDEIADFTEVAEDEDSLFNCYAFTDFSNYFGLTAYQTVENNYVEGFYRGLSCFSSGTYNNNTINDSYMGICMGQQSAIYATGAGTADIVDNTITNCEIGVMLQDGSVSYINRNTFSGNTYDLYHMAEIVGTNHFWGTIQDAINNASDGDTINVAAGTYTEQLIINKSITLMAGSSPVLDFSGYSGSTKHIVDAQGAHDEVAGIYVNASDVTIDGFHFIGIAPDNMSNQLDSGLNTVIRAYTTADNLTVQNCVFDPPTGSVGRVAITVKWADNLRFLNNEINDYIYGVNLVDAGDSIDNALVQGNTFTQTQYVPGYASGMWFDFCEGVQLWLGDNLQVINNTFTGPGTSTGTGNLPSMVAVLDFNNYFEPGGTKTIRVENNTIENYYVGVDTCSNGIVEGNTISNNAIGVYVEDVSGIAPTINYNNIEGNSQYGVINGHTAVTLDATYNWWGDATGPYHSSNPYGRGDNVSDNVDYTPWLDDEYPDVDGVVGSYWEDLAAPGMYTVDGKADTDTEVDIYVTGTTVTILLYEDNPEGPIPDTSQVGIKFVDVSVDGNFTWANISIYYTQAEIDALGLNEDNDLVGIAYWNSTSLQWVLFQNTGVNTTDVGGYAGYFWVNTTHLTPLVLLGADNTPPTTTANPLCSYTDPFSGITYIGAKVNLTAIDTASGVNHTYYRYWWNGTWYGWYEYTGDYFMFQENCFHYLEYYSVDVAGNVEPVHNVSYNVDATPPHSYHVVGDPKWSDNPADPNYAKWVTTHTKIYLYSDDYTAPQCNVGSWRIYYRIWNETSGWGPWKHVVDDGVGDVVNFTFNETCVHHVEFYGVDNVCNNESEMVGVHNVTFYVDDTPPTVTKEYGKPKAVGHALCFDGVDDYVEVPDDSSLQPGTSDWTVEAWIKTTSDARGGIVRKNAVGSWQPVYDLELQSDGTIRWLLHDGTSSVSVVSTIAVNDGEWHHIVGTWDGSTASLYIDGVLDNSQAGSLGALNPDDELYIGAMADGSPPNFFFEGCIDDVRIYSKALSDTEVMENYNGNVTTDGLVSWWNFNDEGTTGVAYDSVDDNHGTIYGAEYVENLHYITGGTPIYINATEAGCMGGVDSYYIYYRVWYNGIWTDWFTPGENENVVFTLNDLGLGDDCVHYIEYYAKDDLNNTSPIYNNTVYVDNTPPTFTKEIVGDYIEVAPGVYYVKNGTKIYINASDPGDCAVGSVHIHYGVWYDGVWYNGTVIYNPMNLTYDPVILSEGFEGYDPGVPGGIPPTWAVYDNDTDGYTWQGDSTNPYEGNYHVKCHWHLWGSCDDWLVTPLIHIPATGDTFEFYARAASSSYQEDWEVWITTTGTTPNDFINNGEMIGSGSTTSTTYQLYSYAIPSTYNDQDVYLAIRCTSYDAYYLYVDAVSLPNAGFFEGFEGTPPSGFPPAGWTMEVVSGTDPDNEWDGSDGTNTHPSGVTPQEGSAMAQYDCFSIYSDNSARLYTPKLDFTGYQNCQLTFWMYHDSDAGDDKVVVQASLDGSTWTNLSTFQRTTVIFPPTGWTVLNEDGDSYQWEGYETTSAHGGDYVARVHYNSAGCDDWLITPQITVPSGGTFSFWARSYSSSLLEDFEVRLSTTGTDPSDFTVLLGSVTDTPYSWTEYSYDLSSYAGQDVYLAVRCVSIDEYYLYVDDFTLPDGTTEGFEPTAPDGWYMHTVDLSAYDNTDPYIGFLGISDYGNSIYVDNITITGEPIPPPAAAAQLVIPDDVDGIDFTENCTHYVVFWIEDDLGNRWPDVGVDNETFYVDNIGPIVNKYHPEHGYYEREQWINLHTLWDPIFDWPVFDPVGGIVHEIYPEYCNFYEITSFLDDNGDGILSPCDIIDMQNVAGDIHWYHVENVTITLVLYDLEMEEYFYVELAEGTWDDAIYTVMGTWWHEKYPVYSWMYQIVDWEDNPDTTPDGRLSFCDYVLLYDPLTDEYIYCHVEDVAVDMWVTEVPYLRVCGNITLEAEEIGNCTSGVQAIFWGFWYDGVWHPTDPLDEYHGNVVNTTYMRDGRYWYEYNESLGIHFYEECFHIIEYWAKDNLENFGPIYKQFYQLDNTTPISDIEINGVTFYDDYGNLWISSHNTTIGFDVYDPGNCSAGADVYYQIWYANVSDVDAYVEEPFALDEDTFYVNDTWASSAPDENGWLPNPDGQTTWKIQNITFVITNNGATPVDLLLVVNEVAGDGGITLVNGTDVNQKVYHLPTIGAGDTLYYTISVYDYWADFIYAEWDWYLLVLKQDDTLYTQPFVIGQECFHMIEWWAKDHVCHKEENHTFFAFVDDTYPVINKTVGDPSYQFNETVWYVNNVTNITIDAYENDVCDVGLKNVSYRIWYDGSWTPWINITALLPYTFNFSEECKHFLEIYAEDELGHWIIDNETFFVDASPPSSWIIVGDPKYPHIETEPPYEHYVTSNTHIYLYGDDESCYDSADLWKIFYRVWYDGSWTPWYEGDWWEVQNFTLDGECKHIVEWYAFDGVQPETVVHNHTFYVDDSAPDVYLDVEEWNVELDPTTYFVDEATLIHINATDLGLCKVDGYYLTWRIFEVGVGYIWTEVVDSANVTFAFEDYGVTAPATCYVTFYVEDYLGNRNPPASFDGWYNYTFYIEPMTDGDYGFGSPYKPVNWITNHTPINLYLLPSPYDYDNFRIWYRVWYNGVWTAWQQGDWGENVSFTLESLGLTEDCIHHVEFKIENIYGSFGPLYNFTVYSDNTPPEITKIVGDPSLKYGDIWYVTQDTIIEISAEDFGCMGGVGMDHISYEIWYDGSLIASGSSSRNISISFTEDCVHYLNITAMDLLGNKVYDNETFHVDSSPASSSIWIGQPNRPGGLYVESPTTFGEDVLLNETFEPVWPSGWEIWNLGDNGDTWNLTDYYSYDGDFSAYVSGGSYGETLDEWLVTPPITLPATNPWITFYHMATSYTYDDAPNHFMISTDDGATWTVLGDYYYDNGTLPIIWTKESYNLSSYAGMTVRFAWHYQSTGWAEAWYVDYIWVGEILATSVLVDEDFSTGIPSGWTVEDVNGNGNTWTWDSTRQMMNVTSMISGEEDNLTTASFSCVGFDEVILTFWSETSGYNECEIYVSNDGGTTWNFVADVYSYSPQWETFDISEWAAGYSNVMVRWHFYNSWHYPPEYWGIDNVTITATSYNTVMEESFEQFPPAGWERWDFGDESPPKWNDNDWHLYDHYTYGWVAEVYYYPIENQDDWLVTPILDCSGYTNVTLKFWHYFSSYSDDYGYVLGSTDGGATWDHVIDVFTADEWGVDKEYDISSWAAGQSQVRIAFRYVAYNDWYWLVDNVMVIGSIQPLTADADGPYTANVGQAIQFIGSASGGMPPYSFAWDFDNDGVYDAFEQNPVYAYGSSGTYTVVLNVTDSLGNWAVDTTTATVGGKIWVTSETPIWLNATDTGDCAVGSYKIFYRWYFNGEWSDWYAGDWNESVFLQIPEECNHTLIWYAIDDLGNNETDAIGGYHSQIFLVDNTPPEILIHIGEPRVQRGDDIWINCSTLITLEAYDRGCEGGVGLDTLEYRIDGGDWIEYVEPFTITTEGEHLLEVKATDYLGNDAIKSMYLIVDCSGPTVEKSIGTPQYLDGLYVTTSTPITITAEDLGVDPVGVYAIHYIINGEENIVYDDTAIFTFEEECEHTLEFWAEDWLGNEGEHVVQTHYVDDTAPTTTKTYGEPYYYDGETEWITSDTLIYLSAEDTGDCACGVAEIWWAVRAAGETEIRWHRYDVTGPFNISEEGTYTIFFFSIDNLGNAEMVRRQNVTVDNTPPISWMEVDIDPSGYVGPVSTFTIYGDDGDGVGYVIKYTINGGEVIEGEPNTPVSFQLPQVDGRYIIEYWAEDLLGNEEEHHEEIFYMDATPPTTTLSFDGDAEWVEDHYVIGLDTKIVLSAIDNNQPVGVKEIRYSIDDGKWQTYEEPFTMDAGMHMLSYYAVDNLDNVEETHMAWIDVGGGAAPVTTCELTPSQPNGNNGWYVSDVIVTLIATDSDGNLDKTLYRVDGGNWLTYEGPFTISADGSHILEYYSVDKSHNTEPVKTTYINIDKFAPEINVIKPKNALYIFGREILPLRKPVIIGDMHIEVDITDPHTSGVEQAQLIIDGETKETFTTHLEWIWDERAIGTHTITIVASDKAGNEATKEIQVIIFNL